MKAKTTATLLGAVGGVGGLIAALRRGSDEHHHSDPNEDRWHAITVNRPPQDISAEALPEPLGAMGESIEVRILPATGDKGTEIHARLRDESSPKGDSDDDPNQLLRRALRESRSLLELGEVIQPNVNRTTQPTLLNRPIAKATQHGREGGLL